MSGMLQRLGLYLRTVRWMRLSQIVWFVYRRLRGVSNPAPVDAEPARARVGEQAWARPSQPDTCELRFLNVAAPATPEGLDWHPADQSRLWRYNLHYFDYLHWEKIPAEHKPAYIDSWIAANPVGCEDAWEPYTVSLRIVNWIKYFQSHPDVPTHWQLSLVNQANWLLHNLEHHILANHLYKNAKALVFAGAWFSGATGQKLLRDGTRLFTRETREQLLPDGGHYERSPMYHCIVLEDLLDVLNLMQTQPTLFVEHDVARVKDGALAAAAFIDGIVCADGDIPLFNDSALGIAPATDELLDYARRVAGYERLAPARQPMRINYPDSGYYGYRHGGDSLLIDCGRIGPDYQPGHTHCDFLSFELCFDGRRLIVDPGVLCYEPGEDRRYLRSTAAHNTVTLDGAEQSEIWGAFRVARRAEPLEPRLTQIEAGRLTFSGAHTGFRRLPQRALHRRRVEVELGTRLEVTDIVEGSGSGHAESYLHFAPGIEVRAEEPGRFAAYSGSSLVASVEFSSGCEVRIATAYTARRFGERAEAQVLVATRTGPLPLRLECSVAKAALT